jgi:hypothetical protein
VTLSRLPAFSGLSVRLPVGLWIDGVRQRDVSIRALSGADEELIGDAARWPSSAVQVTALLTAAVTRLGPLAPISPGHIQALTVLDRDVLLIALRQLLFGDRIQSTVNCPHAECGRKIDLDFRLSELPIPDRSDAAPEYELVIEGQSFHYRLPNGGDQEAIASIVQAEPDRAEQLLMQRCVEGGEALTADQQATLREDMARHDPQLETESDVHCPECGNDFSVHFDIQDFLLREIAGAHLELYQQVHTLAWYYHWSEAEILAMPYQKRHIYLDLLADLISELEEARA